MVKTQHGILVRRQIAGILAQTMDIETTSQCIIRFRPPRKAQVMESALGVPLTRALARRPPWTKHIWNTHPKPTKPLFRWQTPKQDHRVTKTMILMALHPVIMGMTQNILTMIRVAPQYQRGKSKHSTHTRRLLHLPNSELTIKNDTV